MNGPRDDDPDNGFGHESGPDFAPPGSNPHQPPPQYGPPQQYQPPAQYGAPPQYSGPPPGQGPYQPPYGYPQQPPPPRRSGFMIPLIVGLAVVLVLALIGVGIGSWFSARAQKAIEPIRTERVPSVTVPPSSPAAEPTPAESTAPSETPIPSATAPTQSPSRRAPERTEGPGFKFAAPPGWKPSPEWGQGNSGRIVDDAGNQISIYLWDNADARRRCEAELKALAIWEPGEISDLKDRKVGGKPAPGGQLVGESTYRMRCVSANKAVYNISLKSAPGDLEASDRAYNAMLDSWKWT